MEQKIDVKLISINLSEKTLEYEGTITVVSQEAITTELAQMGTLEWAEAIRSARGLKETALEKRLIEVAKTFGIKFLDDATGLYLFFSNNRVSGTRDVSYKGRVVRI